MIQNSDRDTVSTRSSTGCALSPSEASPQANSTENTSTCRMSPLANAPTADVGTSLVVTVSNRPGALHDMLVPLKANGVSMTKFESRHARSGQWEYYFYIDIEGHPDTENVRHALEELRKACGFFKILGTYPVDVH